MSKTEIIKELNFLDDIDALEDEYIAKYGISAFNISNWNSSQEFKSKIIKDLSMQNDFDCLDYIFSYEQSEQKGSVILSKLGYSENKATLFTHSGSSSIINVINLLKKIGIKKLIVLCPVYFTVIHCCEMFGLDYELMEMSKMDPTFKRYYQLKKHLDKIKDVFDYIIIDCPPSLGTLTSNALVASDSVIIPVQCEFFALEGIMQLLSTIRLAQQKLNPSLNIEGVLLTMLDARTNLGLEVVEDIRSYFTDKVYDTIIPRLVKLSESPSHGKPILAYDPNSRGTEAYINLAKEVIDRNGN